MGHHHSKDKRSSKDKHSSSSKHGDSKKKDTNDPGVGSSSAAARPIITKEFPIGLRDEAISAIFQALEGTMECYIVGGLAFSYWGSQRTTKDVDILVPDGLESHAAECLTIAAPNQFGMIKEGGRTKVWFIGSDLRNYNVDILSSTSSKELQRNFTWNTLTADADSTTGLLSPVAYLKMKIVAYAHREKLNDLNDISFLLYTIASNHIDFIPALTSDEMMNLEHLATKFSTVQKALVAAKGGMGVTTAGTGEGSKSEGKKSSHHRK